MKRHFYFLFIVITALFSNGYSQKNETTTKVDTGSFNYAYWNEIADKEHMTGESRSNFIAQQKKIYLDERNHKHAHSDEEYIWMPPTNQRGSGTLTTSAAGELCTNIDFESGDFTSWIRTWGYHPLHAPGTCCTNAFGDQTIMGPTTTPSLDPYGGFPVVYPLAGSYSVRLGSTSGGGIADRLSQTFSVTAATSNFTYRYAAVLNDGGHNAGEQPQFIARILDANGVPIACTTYSVYASLGSGTYSLSNLKNPTDNSDVYYRGWTDVAVDLTSQIGNNVTMEFTVYDCRYTAHFAYVYLDGLCTQYNFLTTHTICPNVPTTLCAPQGFSTTTWNGPGVINDPNRCISVSAAGNYVCNTILPTGCTGPTFTHVVSTYPNPVISFTPVSTACSTSYTFNSSQSISSGSIISATWNFGDGGTSTLTNPTYTYANAGLYNVKFKATSNLGCSDSVTIPVNIFPRPNLAFSPPSHCINTLVQFTNTSTIPIGSITGYTWNLGNGATSNLVNPTNTYTAMGTYTITLNGISNNGCTASLTQTLGIFPPPIISFSVNPLCDINGTSFTPATSTAIASGSLASYFWTFGDGGTSTAANPVHIYATPGIYTVNFTAVSNHNCSASTSGVFSISPSPVVAFATTSINACAPNFTFTNNSTIGAGSVSYTWSFGGTNTTTATSPSYTFPSIGDYTVKLIGVSNLGCGDTAVQYISIYPYPVINFSVPASCENAIFTVSTTAVSGSVTSYNWDFGDPASGAANTSTLQNPTHFYSTTNTYTITLNLLSNLNCPSTTVTPITVFPNPVAGFLHSTANNCSLPQTFTNTSTTSTIGGSTLSSFKWDFGAAGTSTIQNPGTVNFPSNGTYSVSLIAITNHNCSDTMSTVIQVHPKPVIDFTLFAFCQNIPTSIPSSTAISVIPNPAASIVSYTWDLGDNTYSNTPTVPPHTYPSAGNYTVVYSATSNMGCITSVSKTHTVHPIAVIDFTAPNVCLGNSTAFTSTQTVSSGTIFSLNWDFGDNTIGFNPNPTHTYSTSGSFPVTYTASTHNECLSTLTKTITVHPLPVVNFTANGGCLNSISNFTESCTIATPASNTITTFNYYFADGGTVTAQSPQHTYTNSGTYHPTLTAITNNGCSNSNTISLIIDPLPDLTFSPTGACENTVIQFTNNSNIALGTISSYTWNFGNGGSSNLLNPTTTYSLFGPKIVTLSATSALGCIGTKMSTLTVHPYPQVTVTPVRNGCKNDTAFVNTNLFIPAGAIQSYTLSFGDGAFNTYSNVVSSYSVPHIYNAYGTFTIHLQAISAAGCAKSKDSIITIYPTPFVNFASSNFCYGDVTVFSNSCSIPAPYTIDEYQWKFMDSSATPISSATNPTHIFKSYNTFSVFPVSLTALSHPEGNPGPVTCSLTTTKNVTIYPIPIASFTANNACFGKPTAFTNSTSAASGTTQQISGYSWYYFNNGLANTTLINPSFIFPSAGTQTVRLAALNSYGCVDDTIQTVTVYNNPVASFTTSNVCFKQNALFTNTTPVPLDGADSTSIWSSSTGTIGNTRDLNYLFSSPGTKTITLTSISTLGCSDKYTQTYTVYPLPNINVLVEESCQRSITQFTNVSSISPGFITSYNWNFGDPSSGGANTSTLTSPTHLYVLHGVFPTVLTAVSDQNCVSNDTIDVTVHKSPFANLSHTLVCAGDKLTFSNLSTSEDGKLVNYLWDFNGDNLFDSSNPSPEYTYGVPGNYNVKLLVTTEYGCSDTMTRLLYANPKAKALFTSDNKTGCPPVCINFMNQTTISPPTPFTTTWEFGDGSPNNTIENVSHCYNAGVYDVGITVVTDVGCISKFKQPGYISIYPVPVADFNVTPDEVDEEDPLIEVTGQMGPDVESVKYYVNDGTTFTSRNFSHYIKNLKNTKPMVVLVAKNKFGCADTVSKVLEIKPSYVIYFPNVFTPNGDGNNDYFMPKGIGILKFAIQIYDRWGHKVFTSNDIADMWDGRIKANDGAIKEDVYTWRAQVTDIFNKTHNMVGHVTVIR